MLEIDKDKRHTMCGHPLPTLWQYLTYGAVLGFIVGVCALLQVTGVRWYGTQPILWGAVSCMYAASIHMFWIVFTLLSGGIRAVLPPIWRPLANGWDLKLSVAVGLLLTATTVEPLVIDPDVDNSDFVHYCHKTTRLMGILGGTEILRATLLRAFALYILPREGIEDREKEAAITDEAIAALVYGEDLKKGCRRCGETAAGLANLRADFLTDERWKSDETLRGLVRSTVDADAATLAAAVTMASLERLRAPDSSALLYDVESLRNTPAERFAEVFDATSGSPVEKEVKELGRKPTCTRFALSTLRDRAKSTADRVTTKLYTELFELLVERCIFEGFVSNHNGGNNVAFGLLSGVYWTVWLLVILSAYGLDLREVYMQFLAILLFLGFGLGPTVSELVGTIKLVFFRRPFSPGDFVKISGHDGWLKVVQTRTWDTHFWGLEGEAIYLPNAMVSSAKVINLQRSAEVWMDSWFQVSATVTREQVDSLRESMERYCEENEWWRAAPIIDIFEVNDLRWMKLYAGGSLRCRWHDRRRWIRERSLWIMHIRDALIGMGLRFEQLPVTVNLPGAPCRLPAEPQLGGSMSSADPSPM
eukprot:TRINITY_DN5578_c0_g1_i9.p1 TRINITY_DN5578_c0_g1~~TRINITY_DN5578_c0_g1_i9.p1  ORF type:complete len:590 (+),score=228.78 TRINITY_DN5578_c0_g1_i9:97-1866(+)